jgi:hypothetical protein
MFFQYCANTKMRVIMNGLLKKGRCEYVYGMNDELSEEKYPENSS